MFRKATISLLLFSILIAAIGMPVNVHACAMAGTVENAPGCGMCADFEELASSDDDESSNGCCDDHLAFERVVDDARTIDASIRLVAPPILAVLPWPTLAVASVDLSPRQSIAPTHDPPDLPERSTLFLLHASLLI